MQDEDNERQVLAVLGTCKGRYDFFFFFQAEDGIRDDLVTGVQTCALPIYTDKQNTSSVTLCVDL